MPHMPGLAHMPLGQEGIGAGEAEAGDPLCAAKPESFFSKCSLPQDGQRTELGSALARTIFSKSEPQSWQTNSRIGMGELPFQLTE